MKVKALKTVFIDGTLREEGEVFEYTGPKNSNVEALSKVTKGLPPPNQEEEKA